MLDQFVVLSSCVCSDVEHCDSVHKVEIRL